MFYKSRFRFALSSVYSHEKNKNTKTVQPNISSNILWPPIEMKNSSNHQINTNYEKPLSSSSSSTPKENNIHKKLSLIAIRRLEQQEKQKEQSSNNNKNIVGAVTSFFDDFSFPSNNSNTNNEITSSSSARSTLNPMRLYIHNMNNNNNTQEEIEATANNNNNPKLQMTKAQKKLQNRLARKQQLFQEHKTLSQERENQLKKRVSILDDDYGNDGEEANKMFPSSTVPIREYTNGRVGRRTFNFLNEKWCSVCNEPVEMYSNHIGRKDHSLLDQHFEGIVEYDRTWLAHKVLSSQQITTSTTLFEKMQQIYATDERNRRVELHSMLSHLVDVGAIDHTNQGGGTNRTTMFGVFLGAHLALHYIIPSVAMGLYPAGSPDQCSNIEDFVSSSYNMETTYDMCDFKSLPVLKERQQDRNQVISSVNAKMNVVRILLAQLKPAILMDDEYQQEVEFAQPQNFLKHDDYYCYHFDNEEKLKQEQQQQVGSSVFEDFYRDVIKPSDKNIIGENKKFSLVKVEDQKSSDHADDDDDDDENDYYSHFEIDQKLNKTAAMETLMAICGRSLVAELVHCRISEYVVRSERPWMGIGKMEQIEPGLFSTPAGPNPPLVRFDLSSRPEADATPWKLKERN